MQRIIKFRAWSISRKEMLWVENLYWFYGTQIYNGEVSVVTCCKIDGTEIQRDIFGGDSILMQFTGRKDKNGEEIYEGDVVRATMRGGNPHFITKIGVIEFGDYLKTLVVHLEDEDIDDSEPVGRFYEIEVIGNIYENPELLK